MGIIAVHLIPWFLAAIHKVVYVLACKMATVMTTFVIQQVMVELDSAYLQYLLQTSM